MVLGGGFLGDAPAVFSSDSKRVFVAADGGIKVYDSTTGGLVGVMEEEDAGKVVAILRRPESEEVISGDTAGAVKVWSSEGEPRVLAKLDQGIKRMAVSKQALYCLTEADASGNAKIIQVNLSTGKAFPIFKVKGSPVLSCNSNLFVYGSGKRVHLWDMSADAQRKAVASADTEHSLGCLGFAADGSLVLGYQSGHIQVIRGPSVSSFADAVRTQRAYLHWHSDAVIGLATSPVDGHFVTGGHEGVAVMWSLESRKTQFLPRVGGRILHVSVNAEGSKWALSTSENSILLLGSADFKVACEIRGLSASAKETRLAMPIAQHPLDPGLCVLETATGVDLQIYDPVGDRHVGHWEVVRQNVVAALPEEKRRLKTAAELPHNSVRLTAFSPATKAVAQSVWMATWEFCESDGQSCLKIWDIDGTTGEYTLVSIFDDPHGRARVTGLAFNSLNGGVELVSVADDGSWRLWRPIVIDERAERAIDRFSWALMRKDTYWDPAFRGSFQSVAFSADGSLMALAMENLVVIYDAESKEELQSLPCAKEPLIGAHFLGSTGSLVAYDAEHVHVWDLERLEVSWALAVKVDAFAVDGGRFAVALKSTDGAATWVAEFGPAKPAPLQTSRHAGSVEQLVYVRAAAHRKAAALLAWTAARRFVPAFPDDFPAARSALPKPAPSSAEPAVLTDLASLVLKDAGKPRPVFAAQASPLPIKPDVRGADLLLSQVPSHVLPPMRLLFASFIRLKLDPA